MSDFQNKLKTRLPEIMSSPELYLHTLDMEKGSALVIEADRKFYKDAIFLDQRALAGNPNGAWVSLDVLWPYIDTGKDARVAPANFIFHLGHSGSTLISRLLDELPSVLGLREPLSLRTMALGLPQKDVLPEGGFDGAFNGTYQLLTRRFSPEQQVIIKTTSMCNNLAPLLLKQNPANRGLGLFVSLEVFLANMLDKKEIPDIDGFFDFRVAALKKRLPDLELDEAGLTRAEKIALSWLTEAAELADLARGEQKQQVLLMDFDRFLDQKDIHLGLIFSHFGLPGADEALGRVLASPVFGSYAKQPDFAFTPENRLAILNESRAQNKAAIAEGLRFVEGLMKNHQGLTGITHKIPLG